MLYLDAVIAAGGVRGQRLTLMVRHDAQNPKETVRAFNAVVREDAPVATSERMYMVKAAS